LKEVSELAVRIKEARQYTVLKLIPEMVGKEVYIFNKDIIRLFRKDTRTPDIDINDRRISRDSHLKICFVRNTLIAEQDNSDNATFLRGEKLTRAELEDGDILDLAHTYKLVVHIAKGNFATHSTILSQSTVDENAHLPEDNRQKERSASGVFIEGPDRFFAMLPEDNSSVPISLTAVGIVFDNAGKSRFSVRDGIVMLMRDGYCSMLIPGEQLTDNGLRYKISAGR
jgi:pSer/pThr/pTyr-binding forkhead associated (FHA) protein